MTQNEAAEPEYPQTRFQPPPGAASILLVRHGASAPARESEPFPLVGGQGDPELAPEGRDQAKLVGERLAGESFAALYVTTLRRTAQTAAPLADRLGLTPGVVADLREVHLGEWESGIFRKHIAEGHPIARELAEKQRWDVIPGAESTDAFAARVRGAIDRLAAAHAGERIAVFTHGGVIGQALALASGARPLVFAGADNCSISELVVTEGHWLVRRFNDTVHLD
ncbi:histidine phosphatase family protein [Prauserella cavernicola]|uniref:Histidine phosphatase family protein n=1 Tax=Prauserella cavernicola TaxID=2800127 RepID=A0A934V8B4_9PSEU|nr:histidine phosphatase family protein [Prauserella cavernicola]MBK1788529.1 histidine phosphatase family protein [Prauserella cavernicola]